MVSSQKRAVVDGDGPLSIKLWDHDGGGVCVQALRRRADGQPNALALQGICVGDLILTVNGREVRDADKQGVIQVLSKAAQSGMPSMHGDLRLN